MDSINYTAEEIALNGMQSGVALDGRVPVFAFPPTVNFYLGDPKSYKQIITLYNPYESPVRFKVLCTAPDKYQVVNPQGTVKASCAVDIVVRHVTLTNANCNVTDKFRIQLQEHKTKKVIGYKDIPATLHSGVPDSKDYDNESTASLDRVSDWDSASAHHTSSESFTKQIHQKSGSVNPVVLIAGVICIAALLMPNEGEESTIPIKLSFNMKLVFSYVLGLVTMVIFRS